MPSFAVGDTDFLLDGRPHRILSGALHYFRVHPGDWADRLHRARLLGLNTIDTYVPWNAHAPRPGEFRTDGGLDLARFLDLVHAEGLHALVRPGPYICAEWDNGGLPPWLFTDRRVGVRRDEPRFLEAVAGYLDAVLDLVVPRQVDRGGPVLMVQVENEYGAFGDDVGYLEVLRGMIADRGVTVPLFTVDQPDHLGRAPLPGVLRTASFGSRAPQRLAVLRGHQPQGPLMCGELWNGWFDSWGGPHHVADPAAVADTLEDVLAAGGSANLYMVHGGTSFGFTSGADDKGTYRPTVTSYDYGAPLDELGGVTPAFHALREVIARHLPVPEELPAPVPPCATPTAPFHASLPLLPLLLALPATRHPRPPTFEELDAPDGPVLYRAALPGGRGGVLVLGEVRDRARVFVDGAPVGTLSRELHDHALVVPDGAELALLVENQGRVNYGPRIGEPKGLVGPVTLGGRELPEWLAVPVPLAELVASAPGAGEEPGPALPDVPAAPGWCAGADGAGPALLVADLPAAGTGPLLLDSHRWGKGAVWVNGEPVGRYWRRGPQRTLHVPGGMRRPGGDRVVVLELDAAPETVVACLPRPELGPTEE